MDVLKMNDDVDSMLAIHTQEIGRSPMKNFKGFSILLMNLALPYIMNEFSMIRQSGLRQNLTELAPTIPEVLWVEIARIDPHTVRINS